MNKTLKEMATDYIEALKEYENTIQVIQEKYKEFFAKVFFFYNENGFTETEGSYGWVLRNIHYSIYGNCILSDSILVDITEETSNGEWNNDRKFMKLSFDDIENIETILNGAEKNKIMGERINQEKQAILKKEREEEENKERTRLRRIALHNELEKLENEEYLLR